MNEQAVTWIRQQLAAGVHPQTIAQQLGQYMPPDQIGAVMTAAMTPSAPAGPMGLPAGPQATRTEGTDASQHDIDKLDRVIAGAEDGNARGRKLPEGTHLVRTKAITYKTKLQYGPRLIHEFIVVESNNGETEIGGTYSDAMDPFDQYDYGPNDIRALLNQAVEFATGTNVRVQWDNRYTAWAISPQQPCAGIPWRLETHKRQSQKSANVKIVHTWTVQPKGTTSLGLGLTPIARAPSQAAAPAAIGGFVPTAQQAGPPQLGAPAPHIAAMLAGLGGGAPAAAPQQWGPPAGQHAQPVGGRPEWGPPAGAPAPQQQQWGPPAPAGPPPAFPPAGAFPGAPPGFGAPPSAPPMPWQR